MEDDLFNVSAGGKTPNAHHSTCLHDTIVGTFVPTAYTACSEDLEKGSDVGDGSNEVVTRDDPEHIVLNGLSSVHRG